MKKTVFTSSTLAAILVSFCTFCLVSCESAEQQEKDRQRVLGEFCTGVAKHLLDRNPDTIHNSITHLQREELTETVFENLQNQGIIPMTELSILKIVDEAQAAHTKNEVLVKSVKPLGSIKKDIVPFLVSGKEIDKAKGKPDHIKRFSCVITCKLNEQTGDYPQVIKVVGLGTKEAKAK